MSPTPKDKPRSEKESFYYGRDSLFRLKLDQIRSAELDNKAKHYDVHSRLKEMDTTSYLTNVQSNFAKMDASELERLTLLDSLTELYNQQTLNRILRDEVARARRYKNPLSVLVLTVDGLNKLTEKNGNTFTDNILKCLANYVLETIRDVDIPARYDLEHFCIVCPQTDMNGAAILAERLCNRTGMEKYLELMNYWEITLSIGIASFPLSGPTAEEMMGRAFRAVTDAKLSGGNTVHMG